MYRPVAICQPRSKSPTVRRPAKKAYRSAMETRETRIQSTCLLRRDFIDYTSDLRFRRWTRRGVCGVIIPPVGRPCAVRTPSHAIFLCIMTERPVGHFKKVRRFRAHAAGTLQGREQVGTLYALNVIHEIHSAVGQSDMPVSISVAVSVAISAAVSAMLGNCGLGVKP